MAEPRTARLSEFQPGQQGDCFVLLASRERSTTRDGKPYYRVMFRDAARSATCMIWSDTSFFSACESSWRVGTFYKVRAQYDEGPFGAQLVLDRIREVQESDREAGFDPLEFAERSRYEIPEMYARLLDLVRTEIESGPLQQLVLGLIETHAERLQMSAAAARHHHAFVGGFLEHVLSVAKTCVYLAEKYASDYGELRPPLDRSLVVAGGVLHDIGKLQELETSVTGTEYTVRGRLVGHILLGRDMIREAAGRIAGFPEETLLRLEHVIIAHHNVPEFGSPIPPLTLEALLVHVADDLDAKVQMMAQALARGADNGEPFTAPDNPLKRRLYRGPSGAGEET